MKAYYESGGVQIFLGDCREILPALPEADTILTDPIWPNAALRFEGMGDPTRLFAEAAALFRATRFIVQIGCDSDPRFLAGVPTSHPFFRACWLEYACPTRKGRVLYSGDVAYVFGTPPPSRPGRVVIGGRYSSARSETRAMRMHGLDFGGRGYQPTPRRLEHVRWLVARLVNGLVIDPFAGLGTTLVAAKDAGYPAIGIEIDEAQAEQAAKRLGQSVMDFGTSAR